MIKRENSFGCSLFFVCRGKSEYRFLNQTIIFLIFEMQNFKTSILAKKVQIDQKTNEKFNCFSKKKNSDLNSEKFYPQIAQRISNSN